MKKIKKYLNIRSKYALSEHQVYLIFKKETESYYCIKTDIASYLMIILIVMDFVTLLDKNLIAHIHACANYEQCRLKVVKLYWFDQQLKLLWRY